MTQAKSEIDKLSLIKLNNKDDQCFKLVVYLCIDICTNMVKIKTVFIFAKMNELEICHQMN